MRKTLAACGLLCVLVAALACERRAGPSAPEGGPDDVGTSASHLPGPDASDIEALIDALFPPPGLRNAARAQFRNIDRQLHRGEVEDARDKMFDLVEFTLAKLENDQLLDPPGPQTTEEAVAELLNALFQFVGFPDPGFGASLFGAGDVGVAVVGPDGATVVTNTQFAGTEIPEDALDDEVVVTIERLDVPDDVDPCLPTNLEQAEGCYRFDTSPALSEVQSSGEDEFNELVTVGVCLDPDVEDDPDGERFQLHKFDPEKPGEGTVALENAPAPFLECDGFTAMLHERGVLYRYASGGWEAATQAVAWLLAPDGLEAADSGAGGLTLSYSNIGWAKPLTLTAVAGDGQDEEAGTTLPIDPKVLAETTHPTVEPAAGVDLTFTFTDPVGAETSVTVTTDANGEVSAPWTLGAAGGKNFLDVTGPSPDTVAFAAIGRGLVSHWPAEGSFDDVVGVNDGIPDPNAGAPGFAPGIDGQALDFDASEPLLDAPATNFAETQRLTVELWSNLDPAGSDTDIQRFVSIPPEKAVLGQASAPSAAARRLEFFIDDVEGPGLDLDILTLDNALQTGCFHHVAGSYDGSVMRLYLDGQLVGSKLVDEPMVDGNSINFSAPLQPLLGLLDEVKVHNRALTDQEVADAFAAHSDDPEACAAASSSSSTAGEIAFESTQSGDWDVWIMDADGSNQANLTSFQGKDDRGPDWSPDGGKIAFYADRDGDGDFDIWVMDADGSNQTQLTDSQADDRHPAWSPDGTEIAFSSDRDGFREIWVMDADGTDVEQLTDDGVGLGNHRPDWDPQDDGFIVFDTGRFGTTELEIAKLDRSNPPVDGGGVARLTNNAASDSRPRFNPTGTEITFTTDRDGGDFEVYLMDDDGGNQTRLTNSQGIDADPSWSADGTFIGFASNRTVDFDIFIVDPDTPSDLSGGFGFDGAADRAPAFRPATIQ